MELLPTRILAQPSKSHIRGDCRRTHARCRGNRSAVGQGKIVSREGKAAGLKQDAVERRSRRKIIVRSRPRALENEAVAGLRRRVLLLVVEPVVLIAPVIVVAAAGPCAYGEQFSPLKPLQGERPPLRQMAYLLPFPIAEAQGVPQPAPARRGRSLTHQDHLRVDESCLVVCGRADSIEGFGNIGGNIIIMPVKPPVTPRKIYGTEQSSGYCGGRHQGNVAQILGTCANSKDFHQWRGMPAKEGCRLLVPMAQRSALSPTTSS